jgi:hypothetical protein
MSRKSSDGYDSRLGEGSERTGWAGNLSTSAAGIVVLLVIGLFVAAFWFLVQAAKATIQHPKIMLPFLLALIILVAIAIITSPGNSGVSSTSIQPVNPVSVAKTPEPTFISTQSPTPTPTASAIPSGSGGISQWVVIANTDKVGVFLRNSPNMEDKTVAYPEGTRMRVIGPDTENQGRRWKQVATGDGRTGWVPAEYTAPAAGP